MTDQDRITIGPVRLGFENLLTPWKDKYSATILIPKTAAGKEIAKKLHALAVAAVKARWPDEKTRPRKLGMPVKDADSGDATNDGIPKSEKYPAWRGHYYVDVGTKFAVPVVDQKRQPILNKDAIFAGCWVNLNVNAYCYSREKSGASIGLNAVQLVREDERLGGGGGANPDEVFRALDLPADGSDADPFKDSSGLDDLGDSGAEWDEPPF